MERREHAFTDVVAQPDPAAWVEVLDRVGQEPLYAAYKRRTVELLDPQPGDRYLEVGMGTGTDALACAARFGVDVVGADSSSVMVEEARAAAGGYFRYAFSLFITAGRKPPRAT
jgi:ubiquinone/menaquinone biosynthesis C-methylase UbiE